MSSEATLSEAGRALREAYHAEFEARTNLERAVGRVEALATMLQAVSGEGVTTDEDALRDARAYGQEILRDEIAKLREVSSEGNYIRLVELAQAAPDVQPFEGVPEWARRPVAGEGEGPA